MNNWSSGYVADIGYTYGYYGELNPLRIKLAFINAGLVWPEVGTACELGFGQGVSANIHAAASVTKWHGTDFNPSQAGFAQDLARASGSGARLYDDAFKEFAEREDLPEFDYIGLHGIWSWISDENRAVIVDFIARKLKVGGVLYISYNTLPGWAAFAPIRHLMNEHAQIIGSEGHGIVSRINGAVEFADKLLATNPLFSRANPLVGDRIKRLSEQNRHYLAHEYFNRDWLPMHFSTMAEWLEPAKLSYACSAHYVDYIDAVNLTAEQQTFLEQFGDPMFREAVRDFMVNQQFRRDYWVKGARRLSTLAQAEAFNEQRVILTSHRPDVSLKVKGALGDADMNAEVYNPILDLMADHKPRSVLQIYQAVKDRNVQLAAVKQGILVLIGAGHIAAIQDDAVVTKARKITEKLNNYVMNLARASDDVHYLASPLTGGAYNVGRFPQLFLLALAQGRKQPQEWAQYVWEILSLQNQRIIKDGATLETAEQNLEEIGTRAQEFALKQLPTLKALQIV